MNPVLSPRPDTRFLVLDSALSLFTERGYFNTSVHDIGRVAGVSIGSIYHHFGDKAGIASALYAHLGQRMEGLIEEILRRKHRPSEQAKELIARLFQLTESEPRAMQFMLYARHSEFLLDQQPVCSSRPFELMRDMVRAGIQQGEIRSLDCVVASASLFGGALRLITARLDGLLPNPLTDYLDQTWDCAWRSVANEVSST